GQQEQDPGATLARERVALRRLEAEQRPGADLGRVAAGGDAHRAVDDRDPRVLLHLVLAELLARGEDDEHRARAVVLGHDDRVAHALRSGDLEQVPALHGVESTAPRFRSPHASGLPRNTGMHTTIRATRSAARAITNATQSRSRDGVVSPSADAGAGAADGLPLATSTVST